MLGCGGILKTRLAHKPSVSLFFILLHSFFVTYESDICCWRNEDKSPRIPARPRRQRGRVVLCNCTGSGIMPTFTTPPLVHLLPRKTSARQEENGRRLQCSISTARLTSRSPAGAESEPTFSSTHHGDVPAKREQRSSEETHVLRIRYHHRENLPITTSDHRVLDVAKD